MSQLRLILAGGAVQELRLAARLAQEAGAQVRLADDGAEALSFARSAGADLILADVSCEVPGLIAALRRERVCVPVLACGVDAPAPAAVAAVRAGAIDYLPLPPSRELIAAALLTIGNRRVELAGADPAFRRAVAHAERFAAARVPVLISGEPGTGKLTLARHLHAVSGRSGPPVLFDALAGDDPEALASELFGHARGDFDEAVADRPGKLAEAFGATLIVRRAEALAPVLQSRLVPWLADPRLRVIVTATARDALLPELAAALRLAEAPLPPLRRRPGDAIMLARLFAARLAEEEGLSAPRFEVEALEAFDRHDWPGNVAELEDVVHRAVLLAGGAPVRAADLALGDGQAPDQEALDLGDLVGRSVEEVERALILETLNRCRGNRTSASAILGISVRTMRNKLRAFQDSGFAVAPAA